MKVSIPYLFLLSPCLLPFTSLHYPLLPFTILHSPSLSFTPLHSPSPRRHRCSVPSFLLLRSRLSLLLYFSHVFTLSMAHLFMQPTCITFISSPPLLLFLLLLLVLLLLLLLLFISVLHVLQHILHFFLLFLLLLLVFPYFSSRALLSGLALTLALYSAATSLPPPTTSTLSLSPLPPFFFSAD